MQYILAASIALLLMSCGDSGPAAPPVMHYDTAYVNNGITVDGFGFSGQRISLDGGLAVAWESGNGMSKYIAQNWVDLPGHDQYSAVVRLVFPGAHGEYSWTDPADSVFTPTDAYAVVSLNNVDFVSADGNTRVIYYRDIEANNVTGVFSGALVSAFGDTIRVSDGRMKASFVE
jgi:hypothetical protein